MWTNHVFNINSIFQIRNMVDVLISAGQGTLSTRQLYEMLTIPSKHTWSLHPVSAHGLYLVNVAYDDDALNRMTVDLSSKNCTDSKQL